MVPVSSLEDPRVKNVPLRAWTLRSSVIRVPQTFSESRISSHQQLRVHIWMKGTLLRFKDNIASVTGHGISRQVKGQPDSMTRHDL